MDEQHLKNIVEGALLAAGRPLSLDHIRDLFPETERPDRGLLKRVIDSLRADLEGRAVELTEVASGYRLQVKQELSPWITRLWEEKPARYSRALLETLALIAYRQPITRGEIEDVRGVSVSSNIVKTLLERGWVRVVGHRDVPGRPAMYGTTREFLDYFGLKSLDELPTLSELRDLDEIHPELELEFPEEEDGQASLALDLVESQEDPSPEQPMVADIVDDFVPVEEGDVLEEELPEVPELDIPEGLR
jgi:segregation and condensation protein B